MPCTPQADAAASMEKEDAAASLGAPGTDGRDQVDLEAAEEQLEEDQELMPVDLEKLSSQEPPSPTEPQA